MGVRTKAPLSLAAAALIAAGVSVRARADDQPIDLQYHAYEGCPTEQQFLEQVVGRAAKTELASERARGRKFLVTMTSQRKDTLGKLEIVAGGATASREVKGLNCSEVVSALALFTALAIDPNASATVAPREDNAAAPAASAAPVASVATSVAPIVPPKPPEADDTGRDAAAKHDATQPGAKLLVGGSGDALGSFNTGSALPTTGLGGGLFVQASTPGFGSYRIGGTYFGPSSTSRAKFTFVTGRLDGCPVEAQLARGVAFEPCLALELGRVNATSNQTAELTSSTANRWWVAGDLLARLRLAPLPIFFAEVEAGPSFPFSQYVFYLGTEADNLGRVHRVPAVGWVVGLGLGARIL
jgi:hypothetical protein